jgi:hypothetical protein
MRIEVVFDSGGAAVAGVNQQALIADIQAELDKLAEQAKAEPARPLRKPPPAGAQGDWSSFQWVMDIVTDPAMSQAYARALISAINTILQAAKSKESKADKRSEKTSPAKSKKSKAAGMRKGKPSASTPDAPVRITVQDKEFLLPVATDAIKVILKKIGAE